MLVKRSKVKIDTSEEHQFYVSLRDAFKLYYEINITELPVILLRLNIKIPANVVKFNTGEHRYEINLETGEKLIFYTGDVVDPQPYIIYNNHYWALRAKERKVATMVHVKKM